MSAPDLSTDLPEIFDWLLPELVRLTLDAGDHDTARAAAELYEAAARRTPIPLNRAGAAHCRGMLDADPAKLLTAAQEYHKVSFPLHRAQALENAAVLFAQGGETQAARAAHTDAINIYDKLD